MKVAIRSFIDKIGENNKWEKQTGIRKSKLTGRPSMGIYSKCLYKEIYHQTAENTHNCLNKERMNYQNKGTMAKQANTKISKEYVTKNPSELT